jgi:uncharacterized protein YbcC (UPF0753/DUF2309 family)
MANSALHSAIEHAAHLLPAQGPIGVFVHHNTLHAFEDRPFERAVVDAARIFGAEPFMPAQWYRARITEGRITPADLEEILAATPDADHPLLGGACTRMELRRHLLVPGVVEADAAAIRWLLDESGLGRRFVDGVSATARATIVAETTRWLAERLRRGADARALFGEPNGPDPRDLVRRRLGTRDDLRGLEHALDVDPEACTVASLWSATCRRVESARVRALALEDTPGSLRLRDRLLHATGRDTDDLVHPVLVPAISAFLDQGVAYWPMAQREHGFHSAFRELVLHGARLPIPLLAEARDILRTEARHGATAEESVRQSLAVLGIPQDRWPDALAAIFLALPGWAGLMHRLEHEPELAPYQCPPCRLVDYLAVRMVLERAAAARVAREELGLEGELDTIVRRIAPAEPRAARDARRASAFLVFQLAQVFGVSTPAMLALPDAELDALLAELSAFDDVERRRVLQLAYELRHRMDVLRPLARHLEEAAPARDRPTSPPVRIQAAFCIDDREESLRRHLEEADPQIETFGAAGFFGLAIAYRGIEDGQHAAMCPIVQVPAHEIREVGVDASDARRYVVRRKAWSFLSFGGFFGSRSLVRGWVATFGFGLLSMLPLAFRVLFPGFARRVSARIKPWFLPRPETRLSIRRADEPAEGSKWRPGFTEVEMADRIERLLQDIGLVRGFAPLVAMIGHGSSSLNNPHESAYDCGACGGHRGMPNGRLFAAMASDPAVRALLAERGLRIPESTVFVGGYHDTCSDEVRFFDVDAVPATHRAELEHLRAMLDRARKLDAHERCRRFESVPLDVTPETALLHVEGRAENLAEPRPECGHATNAVCIFGRRRLTRGLFLDRRAFLVSYDPEIDPDAVILGRLLAGMGPVGAGINLEYYFSYVDNEKYGCGTKLPHNVAGLMGVMNGHVSDIRTGLPWQMVEIHEPVRLLVVVEATPQTIAKVVERHPEIGDLVSGGWIQLALVDPRTGAVSEARDGEFVRVPPVADPLPVVPRSIDWYRGRRGHLPMAVVSRDAAGFSRRQASR